MYTDPVIVNSEKSRRPYISFYLNGIRQRVYSGRVLGISIYPNKAKKHADRLSSLQALRKELLKALAAGSYPYQPPTISKNDEAQQLLEQIAQLTAITNQIAEQNAKCISELERIKKLLENYC